MEDVKVNKEALDLLKTIHRLRRKKQKVTDDIRSKEIELQRICDHHNTIENETYVHGGLLSREEYITTITCTFCDKVLDRQVKYGSFC